MGKINMSISIDFDDAVFDDPAADAEGIDVVVERARNYLVQDSIVAGEIAAEIIEQLRGYITWVDADISIENER